RSRPGSPPDQRASTHSNEVSGRAARPHPRPPPAPITFFPTRPPSTPPPATTHHATAPPTPVERPTTEHADDPHDTPITEMSRPPPEDSDRFGRRTPQEHVVVTGRGGRRGRG